MIFLYLLIFLGLGLLIYMYVLAHSDHIEWKTITDKHFPSNKESLTIFFISDIHKRLIKLETLDKVSGVDIAIIGGDLCEKKVPFTRVEENIRRLKKLNAPIYFVWGNNDYEVNYRELDARLLDQDVHILADTSTTLEFRSGEKIQLVGLDSLNIKEINTKQAFEHVDDSYTILAVHEPEAYDELLTDEERNMINIIFSGHTHGGQIRILGFSLRKRGGWVKKGQTHFLTSEGYGTTKLPLRLGTRAECHVVTIEQSKA
ncbi:metallophosphoesterase [Salinibacillus xinjiangensis]|nr:metallophosphoesterase [Salinibacillus xinjiangensis]